MKERGIVVRVKSGAIFLISMKADLVPRRRQLTVDDLHHEYHGLAENVGAVVEVDDIGEDVGLTRVDGVCSMEWLKGSSAMESIYRAIEASPAQFYATLLEIKAP